VIPTVFNIRKRYETVFVEVRINMNYKKIYLKPKKWKARKKQYRILCSKMLYVWIERTSYGASLYLKRSLR